MEDTRTVLSLLLIQLKLEDKPRGLHSLTADKPLDIIRGRQKRSGYKFTVKQAIKIITREDFIPGIAVDSCKFGVREALNFIHDCMTSRLLHCPSDRTLERPSMDTELQPTAKALCILELFCKDQGIPTIDIAPLNSRYNTMELLVLERSSMTRNLLFSPGVAMMVWQRMLGKTPNLYKLGASNESKMRSTVTATDSDEKLSPYYHKYFIHPSTNSISQYWDASGVRLFSPLTFSDGVSRSYTITGKAIWQWIMECTTVESPTEATNLARLILGAGVLQVIKFSVKEAVTCKDQMPSDLSRETFYMFTQKGKKICLWGDLIHECDIAVSTFDACPTPPNDQHTVSANMTFEEYLEEAPNGGEPLMTTEQMNSQFARESGAMEALRSLASVGSPTEVKPPENPMVAILSTAKGSVTNLMHSSSTDLPRRIRLSNSFAQAVSLDLVFKEPGLKMVFRKKLKDWRCDEALSFIDDYSRFVSLKKALDQAESRQDMLMAVGFAKQASRLISAITSKYIQENAPREVNISSQLREQLTSQLKDMHLGTMNHSELKRVIGSTATPLSVINEHQLEILQNQIMRFVECEDLFSVPFRTYALGIVPESGVTM